MARNIAVLVVLTLSLSISGCVNVGGKPPQLTAVDQVRQKCPPLKPEVTCPDAPQVKGEQVKIGDKYFIAAPKEAVDAALIEVSGKC